MGVGGGELIGGRAREWGDERVGGGVRRRWCGGG